jgi:xanthine dehydrogenase accessory factor
VHEIAADIERWRSRGDRVAIATVVSTRRSAPRPVGAKLAVSEGGDLAGSVSGGCVENDVYEHARQVLAGGPPRLLTYGIPDDFALGIGLPCGGEIDVFVQRPRDDVLDGLLAAVAGRTRAVRLTVVDGDGLGDESLHLDGERIGADLGDAGSLPAQGRSGLVEVAGRTLFVDVESAPRRLLVFGAVDTAEELSRAARALGWHTTVADPRARLATRERVPSADEVLVTWPHDALAAVRPDGDTAIVVLTHEDRFDVPALTGALATDAFYVGALGSRRTQARRRERLLEEGVDEVDLDRISGPCGLDIGAATPAETAVSILSEIIAVAAGRGGGRLKEGRGRIHADVA